MRDKITVKYQTRKEFCSCCDRDFEDAELGEVREFDVSLEDVFNWTKWEYCFEYDMDACEIRSSADECIYGMISFYAVESNERLRLCDGELDKIVQAIVDKYTRKGECE